MTKYLGFQCSLCGQEYEPDEAKKDRLIQYTCPKDGGNLDVVLDIANIQKYCHPDAFSQNQEASLWRYLPLLPVNDPENNATPLHAAGWTPVFAPPRLAESLNLHNLWIKDESRNPTASFKDRASAVVVARAREIGAEVVVTASTGNAGAALAGMAAAVGQKAIIFAPRTAPPAKIAQLLIFGAQVLLVDGNYDDAFDLTIQASQEFGWYCRNTGYNPFTAEGKKTAALEIWEHFSYHQQPSRRFKRTAGPPTFERVQRSELGNPRPLSIFVSVGDGNIISGIHKGFKDLQALGWLEHMPSGQMPRIFGVQAEGSAAIANAFISEDERIIPVSANTLADSISVDLPRDGVRAVRAARQTGGQYILVSDEEILQAIAALGQVGIFAEPAGATSYAGLVKAVSQGLIAPTDPVLVINTGSGLKDVKAAMQAVRQAPVIEPSIDAVKKVIGSSL